MALFFKGHGPAGSFAATQTLRAYWEGLRPGGTGIPGRLAIDPRGLSPVLDRVFLAEEIAPGQLRLRIAGMALTELAGADMKGLPLSLLFRAESRDALASACRAVLDGPSAVEIQAEAERGLARPALSARLVMLPLLATDGVARLVLGCLAAEGAAGRSPRRFAISRVTASPLTEPASRQAPAEDTPCLASHGHLRLVHSA